MEKNSCRYDSFSLIYAFVIYPKLQESGITPEHFNEYYINKLFYNCIQLKERDYKIGFWEYLKKNKENNLDLTTSLMCFGKKGSLY